MRWHNVGIMILNSESLSKMGRPVETVPDNISRPLRSTIPNSAVSNLLFKRNSSAFASRMDLILSRN